MEHVHDYLIVGGGMAADAAAKAIRRVDAEADVALLSTEADPPYQRPPLSKALWTGAKQPDQIDLGTAEYARLELGRRAVALDAPARCITDDRDERWRYRHLLLATGASPRRLAFAAGERLVYFRSLADYRALRALAVPGAHVGVVGGGFIGSELAAAMAMNGCKVTMLFPGPSIGSGRYPDGLSRFLDDYFRQRGVNVRSGANVADGRAAGNQVELDLDDGSQLRFDAVAVGIGVVPDTLLAEQAGLTLDHGIVVDEYMRSSDPAIWAAGDVASFHSAALDRRMRVEHEDAAVSMGHHAGLAMAGQGRAYTAQPFFYSDLFDLGYEAVGLLDTRLEVVEDWKEPNREGVVYYLDQGRVRGVLLWNTWDQLGAARALLADPGPFDAASLRGRLPAAK